MELVNQGAVELRRSLARRRPIATTLDQLVAGRLLMSAAHGNVLDGTVAISCGERATVKMLTQDGSLVEIDKKLLASSGKKISNKELQEWIKK